ncbi:hypothetical protein [Streptomyces inusitatus]|uniref:hypothetical protein n=1 Tax=Streptomyces inusitatus TaxID=68221 RepID=UPI00167E5E48|nr:hypothetical protein [Streptomyces inusitatus]
MSAGSAEVRTQGCLAVSEGTVTALLVSECKAKDWLGYWPRTTCNAWNLSYKLTDPTGAEYKGWMRNNSGRFFDTYSTSTHPCVVGEWTYDQASMHDVPSVVNGLGTGFRKTIEVTDCGE